MKNINKNQPPFENKSEESKDKERAKSTENSEIDPLEVVIQEEKDDISEEVTQDDMFDDDELDLDLEQDEW